jgi:LysM repeat protein
MDGYNSPVRKNRPIRWFILFAFLAGILTPTASVFAVQPQTRPEVPAGISAYDLIAAMNTLRVSYGHPALVEDPIIDAVAQSTAEIMAANEMSWHIGNVSGRLTSAGYGGGVKVWATENFAVGNFETIDQIMVIWSDASHMLPAVTPAYCNIGAGTAQAPNGMTYYVLQAAYTESGSCGAYTSPTSASGTNNIPPIGVSQVIIPVKIATPDADGKIYHVVEAGQSFWSIAIAYKITIKDLETWNNISRNTPLQVGQRLFIPSGTTAGYATPTPVGLVQVSTPDATGKIIHIVQAYQTLTTIAQAYGVDINTILTLNGIQLDTPLQIGQKLVIRPSSMTPTLTPRPQSPLELLTPASDGKYYHIVQSGETLSGIARLYGVPVADLMAWNGLNASSILQVNQKLLLQVTPPPTKTSTLSPPTLTPTASRPPATSTSTPIPTPAVASSSPTSAHPQQGESSSPSIFLFIGLVAVGLFLAVIFVRRKPKQE